MLFFFLFIYSSKGVLKSQIKEVSIEQSQEERYSGFVIDLFNESYSKDTIEEKIKFILINLLSDEKSYNILNENLSLLEELESCFNILNNFQKELEDSKIKKPSWKEWFSKNIDFVSDKFLGTEKQKKLYNLNNTDNDSYLLIFIFITGDLFSKNVFNRKIVRLFLEYVVSICSEEDFAKFFYRGFKGQEAIEKVFSNLSNRKDFEQIYYDLIKF